MRRRSPSPETRAKLSAALKGRSIPEEIRIKRVAAARRHSEETLAKMSAAHRGHEVSLETRAKISTKITGITRGPLTDEQRGRVSAGQLTRWKKYPDASIRNAKISSALKGIQRSQATKDKLAQIAVFNWDGGQTAKEFAAVLCPAGFIREHRVLWGKGNQRFKLDFAHVEGKVCIELDGPSHKSTKEYDNMRDIILRDMGWRIIRIAHD